LSLRDVAVDQQYGMITAPRGSIRLSLGLGTSRERSVRLAAQGWRAGSSVPFDFEAPRDSGLRYWKPVGWCRPATMSRATRTQGTEPEATDRRPGCPPEGSGTPTGSALHVRRTCFSVHAELSARGRPHRLEVRTSPFQGENPGSIPGGDAINDLAVPDQTCPEIVYRSCRQPGPPLYARHAALHGHGPGRHALRLAGGRSPIDALHKLHAEALGPDVVAIVDGELVFRDPADQELCAGFWKITECQRDGTASSEIEILIPMPARAAA
jgi:hypothetical protein